MIRLGQGLNVTAEIFTTASAIVGIRGSGKTTDGVVLAEQAILAGVPVAVIDPTGAWYGLKSSADGKSAGLPVYVFGGRHADAPLEATAGPIIARFVVERGVPIVLDLSDLSKGMQRRFVGQFCETLYDLKARARDPLFVIVDECPRFCPQRFGKDPDLTKCVGAVEDIVALGRSRGLGCAIIGQRPATINKNILTQADNLFAMRTVGTQDRDAIDDWVTEAQGEQGQRNELVQAIASLKQGEGYFWSPAIFDIFRRVQFDNRKTFDSSRTPKVGEKHIEPKVFASVDLEALSAEIRATVERAKADDPKELRVTIRQLEKELASAKAARTSGPVYDPKPMQETARRVGAVMRDWADRNQAIAVEFRKGVSAVCEKMDESARQFFERNGSLFAALERLAREVPGPVLERGTPSPQRPMIAAQRTAPRAPVQSLNGERKLSKAERSILTVLAQYGTPVDLQRVAILAGYAFGSGGFNNALSALRSSGYIERGDPAQITDAGLDALGTFEPLPEGEALQAYWLARLGKAERAILSVLLERYPELIATSELASCAGYAPNTGGFNNALGRLRTMKLAEGYGEIKAADAFFSGARA